MPPKRAWSIAVEVWYSLPGTVLLYGAFATHFMMALLAVYERRTFRLPPLELLRIVLGFTMPILLIGHAASTRLAYELFGLVVGLHARGLQSLGDGQPRLAAGPDGAGMAARLSRPAFRVQPALRGIGNFGSCFFPIALLLPVLAALGFIAMGKDAAAQSGSSGGQRWEHRSFVFRHGRRDPVRLWPSQARGSRSAASRAGPRSRRRAARARPRCTGRCSLRISSAISRRARGVRVLGRLDLLAEDDVDRALGPITAISARRPGDDVVGLVGPAVHHVVAGAVALAHDHA